MTPLVYELWMQLKTLLKERGCCDFNKALRAFWRTESYAHLDELVKSNDPVFFQAVMILQEIRLQLFFASR